jgi:hypothetical protein
MGGETQPWKIYDVRAPEWVNTLSQIENGGSYWIRATEPITIPVRGATNKPPLVTSGQLPPVPATYYGFVPVADSSGGLMVTALIDGVICGSTTSAVRALGGIRADTFAITVRANDSNPAICGRPGVTVTLVFRKSAGEVARASIAWRDDGAYLIQIQQSTVFLPLVRR